MNKETNIETEGKAVMIPFEDYCTLRYIAAANDTSIPQLVRSWMFNFLDARTESQKDEHFPR